MNFSAASPLVSVLLLLVSMSSIQASASLAKTIFPVIGPAGTTALRLLVAAAILLAVMRPWTKNIPRSAWKLIAVFGLATASMNLCFYEALSRIPLGVAVALEFTGPLTVAMLSSRRLVDMVWVILAAAGLVILLPLRQSADSIDPLGALLALASGVCWALYIVFGKKAGSSLDKSCVALAMLVGSCAIFPVGLAASGTALFTPEILPLALLLGIFSSALPYGVEIIALKNLPSRTFSILMSLEPALAALSGFLFLGEQLNLAQWTALAAIMTASVGSTLTIQRR
ncbi:EamA family transporter [uncultured Desulfovibrio sp.]|uniref:EamA family transporter n=1 Tax=uncultured Desulfovibrio sp. TaxID=167968 RepID=UPI0026316290|nr:EamA family transporter [uncultured Desulfovibrio sp.]